MARGTHPAVDLVAKAVHKYLTRTEPDEGLNPKSPLVIRNAACAATKNAAPDDNQAHILLELRIGRKRVDVSAHVELVNGNVANYAELTIYRGAERPLRAICGFENGTAFFGGGSSGN